MEELKMEKLIEILESIKPALNFHIIENFIYGGVLDSLEIVLLITKIEEEFGFEFSAENMTAENFFSAQTIWELISTEKSYGKDKS